MLSVLERENCEERVAESCFTPLLFKETQPAGCPSKLLERIYAYQN
jgi:hypothetical protein